MDCEIAREHFCSCEDVSFSLKEFSQPDRFFVEIDIQRVTHSSVIKSKSDSAAAVELMIWSLEVSAISPLLLLLLLLSFKGEELVDDDDEREDNEQDCTGEEDDDDDEEDVKECAVIFSDNLV